MKDFKVRCISRGCFSRTTPGKIYEVVNGKLIDDDGDRRPLTKTIFNSVEEINEWAGTFELVEEPTEFKVKCTEVFCGANRFEFHVGGIYQVSDGQIVSDTKFPFDCWSSSGKTFDRLQSWFGGKYKFEKLEESKMFTKENIKVGYVLELDNDSENLVMVIPNKDGEIGVSGEKTWYPLDNFSDGLEYYGTKITKVYGLTSNMMAHKVSSACRELLWERKPPIKEIALSEATKLLTEKFGENVKIVVNK